VSPSQASKIAVRGQHIAGVAGALERDHYEPRGDVAAMKTVEGFPFEIEAQRSRNRDYFPFEGGDDCGRWRMLELCI
jgi:hypothetical protein